MVDEKYVTDGEAYKRFMGRWRRASGDVFTYINLANLE